MRSDAKFFTWMQDMPGSIAIQFESTGAHGELFGLFKMQVNRRTSRPRQKRYTASFRMRSIVFEADFQSKRSSQINIAGKGGVGRAIYGRVCTDLFSLSGFHMSDYESRRAPVLKKPNCIPGPILQNVFVRTVEKKSIRLTKKSSKWTDSAAAGRSPHIGALARGPYLAMLEASHAQLIAAGFPEVSAPYSIVFQTIGDGSRLVDMAARARTTKQNMSQLLEQMIRAGYIARESDPHDGRAAIFRMTVRGRRMRRRAFGIVDRIEANWTQRLGAGKMKALKKLLAELNAIIEAGRDSGSGM